MTRATTNPGVRVQTANNGVRAFEHFVKELLGGGRPDPREVLRRWAVPEHHHRRVLVLMLEFEARHLSQGGPWPALAERYRQHYPELTAEDLRLLEQTASPALASGGEVEVLRSLGFDPASGYRDLGVVGEGAFGRVYRIHNENLERDEAIKLFLQPESPQAILNEARSACRVEHRNVCRIYYVSERTTPPYIRMQFVDGEALSEWWGRRDTGTQRSNLRQLAAVLAKVADAVYHAHQANVIHRDLKPENVKIDNEGEPVVLDFGLSKRLDPGGRVPAPDGVPASLAGTPDFMAPEQVPTSWVPLAPEERHGRGELSSRTDVYALGAILCHLARGPCDPAMSLEKALLRIVRRRPGQKVIPGGANVPADLRRIIEHAMARLPEDRYRSAQALAEDLRLFAAGRPPRHAPPERFLHRLSDPIRRHWRRAAVTCAVLAAVLLVLAGARTLAWEHRRTALVSRLDHLLADGNPADAGRWDRIERDLAELDGVNSGDAAARREQYLDAVLRSGGSLDGGQFSLERLDRLDRGLSALAAADRARAWLWWSPDRRRQFREQTAPYSQTTSLDLLVRPDPGRVRVMERAVNLANRHGLADEVVPALFDLLLVYLAADDLPKARLMACRILDAPNLSGAWRLSVCRFYVWLAIDWAARLRRADAPLRAWADPAQAASALADVSDRVNQAAGLGPEYRSLLVCQAHLAAARRDYQAAEEVLGRYFEDVKDKRIILGLHEARDGDLRLGEGPQENVPALFAIDAYLLSGFIRQHKGDRVGAEKEWECCYRLLKGKPAGTYYGAAVAGSLCRAIDGEDAKSMVALTVAVANSRQVGLPLQAPRQQPAENSLGPVRSILDLVPGLPEAVAGVLNGAWQSERGQAFARNLAFRELPFSVYVRVQARLWLYELLKSATLDAPGGELSTKQDQLLWTLIAALDDSYARGQLSERDLLAGLALGIRRAWLGPAALGLAVVPARKLVPAARFVEAGIGGWKDVAPQLPPDARGPLAYILGRQYKYRFPGRLQDARQFFEKARAEASSVPPGSPLRELVEAELAMLASP